MAQTSMQSIGQCFVFILLTTLCTCASWPEGTVDSQEVQNVVENQPIISDLEKFYSSYRVPSYFNLDDENPMQRLQYQYRFGRRAPPMGARGGDYNLLPSMRDYRTMLSMMTKRVPSPRYRQCYFNPVACFRK